MTYRRPKLSARDKKKIKIVTFLRDQPDSPDITVLIPAWLDPAKDFVYKAWISTPYGIYKTDTGGGSLMTSYQFNRETKNNARCTPVKFLDVLHSWRSHELFDNRDAELFLLGRSKTLPPTDFQ